MTILYNALEIVLGIGNMNARRNKTRHWCE